jgi:hypothetical protein
MTQMKLYEKILESSYQALRHELANVPKIAMDLGDCLKSKAVL